MAPEFDPGWPLRPTPDEELEEGRACRGVLARSDARPIGTRQRGRDRYSRLASEGLPGLVRRTTALLRGRARRLGLPPRVAVRAARGGRDLRARRPGAVD